MNSAKFVANMDPELNAKVLERLEILESSFNKAKELIELKKEVKGLSNFQKTTKQLLPKSDINFLDLPTSNKLDYAMLELTRIGAIVVNELASEVGMNDMKLDKYQIFVELDEYTINLGERIEGNVYFTMYASDDKYLTFLMNDDTLENNNGYSKFSLTPNKKGTQKIDFKVVHNQRAKWLSQKDLVKEIEVEVK